MCENTHGQSTNNAPWSTNPFSFDFFLPQALKDHWTFTPLKGHHCPRNAFLQWSWIQVPHCAHPIERASVFQKCLVFDLMGIF